EGSPQRGALAGHEGRPRHDSTRRHTPCSPPERGPGPVRRPPTPAREGRAPMIERHPGEASQEPVRSVEARVGRAIEQAVFGGEIGRRRFIARVGASTAAAALASVFPMQAARALAQERTGPLEKKDLKVGFIPITCATPIIMAEPMGFYRKHGLTVQVLKASSWAMVRDLSINGETDATHMLSPMPLAISMGVGSQ